MVTGRKKVGILFSFSEGWIGGTYYFINLVNALKSLPDESKPHLIILSDSEQSYNKMLETGYPYMSYLKAGFKYSIFERVINKITRILVNKNVINKGYSETELPTLFGYYEQLFLHKCRRKIYWIPDLQDCHYPEYLGAAVAAGRKELHLKLAYSNSEVVFSSEDSKKDFNKFYPDSKCKKSVVQFAVTLPDFSNRPYNEIEAKYGLKGAYFFSPNQFWSHKNHIVLIEAVKILKQQGNNITVVFTGNEATGGGIYAKKLKEYVNQSGLHDNCLFLGFIDRIDQLVLMKNSKAVIQPSLFEGWSTVIEDAKWMNKHLILSNLEVHHEQINENVTFFSPADAVELSIKIANIINADLPEIHVNYENNVAGFADSFIRSINNH